MAVTAVKNIAEAYVQRVWNDKDLIAVDELVHPNCIIHSPLGDFRGHDPLKKVIQSWLTGFPDLSVENTAWISEADLVVQHWRARGTQKGIFKGISPSNKTITYSGATIYRVQKDKIVEYWAYIDMDHLLKQIS
jgi:predicted ester cyclase